MRETRVGVGIFDRILTIATVELSSQFLSWKIHCTNGIADLALCFFVT